MSQGTQLKQAALGGQRFLVLTSVPATAAQSLVGKRLLSAGALTVAGDYFCRVEIGGLSSVYVHLTANIGAGTAESDITTTFLPDAGVTDATLHASHAYQGFTGDGALELSREPQALYEPHRVLQQLRLPA